MRLRYDAKISGTGRYLPAKILTNFDLEKIVETSDEWIKTRTGMSERRQAHQDEAASDLAYQAAIKALESANLRAKDLDMIICCTISGDHAFPSTACLVQKKLGIKDIPAFDLAAGCTGFIFGADVARQYVENGIVQHVLVIGVEILSRIINWKDRGTCVLFGDGAGAAVISRTEPTDISRLIDGMLNADGSQADLLIQPAGGSRMPASERTVAENLHTISMEGNKIFKLAVKSMQIACETILKRNNIDARSLDWVLPHQANIRIIESLVEKLKVDEKKVIVNIERYANTSAATIPIALDEAIRNKKVRKGDLVLMVAFGAGLTSGSLLIRF